MHLVLIDVLTNLMQNVPEAAADWIEFLIKFEFVAISSTLSHHSNLRVFQA